MARKTRKTKKVVAVKLNCVFCKEDRVPSYKDYQFMGKFLSDRARIYGKKRTGICSKHQRKLGIAIKRARHLGLLPITPTN